MGTSLIERLRLTPDPEVTNLVANHSSRDGVRPGMIVIHTTEGADHKGIVDLSGLGSFFDQSSVQASSHVANDKEGNDARFVRDGDKAWTCSEDNPFTLNIEQIAFARTARHDWYEDRWRQLDNTARWIAYWSEKYDIPIRRGVAPAGILLRKGVASHKQLGISGGGHWDPGPGFPMKYVLLRARLTVARAKNPRSRSARLLTRRVNRIRKHYGLPAV